MYIENSLIGKHKLEGENMKKNWLSGVLLLVTMLICSVSFATVHPSVLAVTAFDVVSVADMHPTGSIIGVGAQIKPDNDGITDIGAGSKGMVADTGDRRDLIAGNCGSCHEADSGKKTDNVTASIGRNFEVGWQI